MFLPLAESQMIPLVYQGEIRRLYRSTLMEAAMSAFLYRNDSLSVSPQLFWREHLRLAAPPFRTLQPEPACAGPSVRSFVARLAECGDSRRWWNGCRKRLNPAHRGLHPWRHGCPTILRMARFNVRQVVEQTKIPDSAHPLVADRALVNRAADASRPYRLRSLARYGVARRRLSR